MRIAYFVNQYPKGSHTFIRREIEALEALGFDVRRIAIRPGEAELADPADRAELARTTFLLDSLVSTSLRACASELAASPRRFSRALASAASMGLRSDRAALKHAAYFVEACILADLVRREGIHHVHAHFGTNSAAVVALARELGGAPYSFTVHGPEEFDSPTCLSLREKIRNAEFVAAISSFCRSQLFRWADVDDWEKIHVVRCGLERSYFDRCERTGIEDGVPTFVTVGRLSPEKGQVILLRAAKLLADRGVEFRVVIVGDGPLRGELEATIEAYGLRDRVTLAGWMDNKGVRAELAKARAFVLPSFAEGLPVVIMEAFAVGCPVISTYVAGIPELVEHGSSGWLVPSGNVERLADAMAEAATTSPAKMAELGRRGHEAARARHDARTEAEKLAELFRRSLERQGVQSSKAARTRYPGESVVPPVAGPSNATSAVVSESAATRTPPVAAAGAID